MSDTPDPITRFRSFLRHAQGTVVDRALGVRRPGRRITTERDVATPMPDGVVLLGDRHHPADQDGPLPVVLVRSPYGRRGLLPDLVSKPLARQGFQVFVQSTRGTFGSGGSFRPFQTEPDDGMATLQWIRRQPWCDGRVAMTGLSYLGHTQWALAPYADPPLTAVSLHITAAQISEAFYHRGGVPGLLNALSWTGTIGNQENRILPSLLPNPVTLLRLRRALSKLPLQAADSAVTGAPVAFWRDFTAHELPGDDFWAPADHQNADLSAMPPVNMVTGWWDLFAREQLHDFARLQAAGVPAQITVGPWQHGEPPEFEAILSSDIEWLSHHLNGAPLPDRRAVRLQLMGADESWLEFDSWPPSEYSPTVHRLGANGVLVADAASEGSGGAPSQFTFNPADPTPTVGGPLLNGAGKQRDNADVEARPDVLTFTGQPLAADLDVIGAPTATIYLRTSTPYADVFVRVCDVDDSGVSRNVIDAIRRLSPKDGPDSVDDAGVMRVELDLFPTAYRFATGHRIRVQVAGGAFPRFARNFGDGTRFAAGTAGVPVDVEVFHDDDHPSAVTLPSKPA